MSRLTLSAQWCIAALKKIAMTYESDTSHLLFSKAEKLEQQLRNLREMPYNGRKPYADALRQMIYEAKWWIQRSQPLVANVRHTHQQPRGLLKGTHSRKKKSSQKTRKVPYNPGTPRQRCHGFRVMMVSRPSSNHDKEPGDPEGDHLAQTIGGRLYVQLSIPCSFQS